MKNRDRTTPRRQPPINVMVFEPGHDGEARSMTFPMIASAIGGDVEVVTLANPGTGGALPIVALCDGEGRLNNAHPNRWGIRGMFVLAHLRGSKLASLTSLDRTVIEHLVRYDFELVPT